MTAAAILGAVMGLGLYLLVRGLLPSRPTLASQVQALLDHAEPEPRGPVSHEAGFQAALERRYGSSLVELLATAGPRPPLCLTPAGPPGDGRSGGDARRREADADHDVVFPVLLATGMGLIGIHLPTAIVALAALPFGAGGFLLPNASLRQRASERRKSFRYALSAFLDLVSISLAGGGLVQGSLQDAVAVGRGWAFDEFRRPLELTREKGRPPWDDVARLGNELGVPELEELAGSLTLAGAEGARVRQSLMAKAESLRQRRMSEAEAEANESSERMVLPLVLLGLGFLLFLGYPAVSRVLSAI